MSRIERLKVAALTAATLAASVCGILACTTHILGPTDIAALRDSVELDCRITQISDALDAGRVRAFARAAAAGSLGVLERSGAGIDAGASAMPCGAAK